MRGLGVCSDVSSIEWGSGPRIRGSPHPCPTGPGFGSCPEGKEMLGSKKGSPGHSRPYLRCPSPPRDHSLNFKAQHTSTTSTARKHRICPNNGYHHNRDAQCANHGRYHPPPLPRHRDQRGGPGRPRRGADSPDGRGLHCYRQR